MSKSITTDLIGILAKEERRKKTSVLYMGLCVRY